MTKGIVRVRNGGGSWCQEEWSPPAELDYVEALVSLSDESVDHFAAAQPNRAAVSATTESRTASTIEMHAHVCAESSRLCVPRAAGAGPVFGNEP
jgi:hypothetical protein